MKSKTKIRSIIKKLSFLIILIFTITSCNCEDCQDCNDKIDEEAKKQMLDKLITPLQAAEMKFAFRNDRVLLFDDELKKKYGAEFNETETVWFDIDVLKEYIRYVEQTSKSEPTGLQFYFSVHPNTNQKNQLTFFVTPTKELFNNDVKSQVGYTLDEEGNEIPLRDLLAKSGFKSNKTLNKSAINPGFILNRGETSPPATNY